MKPRRQETDEYAFKPVRLEFQGLAVLVYDALSVFRNAVGNVSVDLDGHPHIAFGQDREVLQDFLCDLADIARGAVGVNFDSSEESPLRLLNPEIQVARV